MARHVIATEGVLLESPKVLLEKGSLYVEDGDRIFVTNTFEFQDIWGVARDLERDEATGEVSMEIDLAQGRSVDKKLFDFSFYATHLDQTRVMPDDETDLDKVYMLVRKARIRAIAILPIPEMPLKAKL